MTNTGAEGRHNIRWQSSEITAVCAALRYIVASDKGVHKGSAIRQAEEVLPQARRRRKASAALYGATVGAKLNDAYAAGLNTSKVELATLPVPMYHVQTPLPVASVEVTPKPAEPTPEALSIDPEMSEARPSDPWGLVAQLAVEIARDIAQRLDRIESALIARIGPPPGWKAPATAAEVRAKVQRIAIVGPLKDQFEHIRTKVHHLPYQFIWVDKDDRHYRLPQADFVLVSKHCAHAWSDKARRSDTEACFVDGAVSGVVQKIMDIHSRKKL